MRKRSSLNRIIALFVITAVFFAAVLSVNTYAASSKQMTAELFAEKLESFIRDVYADGSKYKNNEKLYMGIQCYGFANQISQYFYGSFPTYDSRGLKANSDWIINYGSQALQELHIGDVVRYRSSAGADHSIFVTGFDDKKIYFSDANGDHSNTVRHNAEITWEKLIGKMDKRLERDSSCIGWVAHYKYWDSDPDHAGIGTQLYFNADGGYIAGEQIAERYIVLDTLNVRSGPGTDNERVAKMYDDTYFEVELDAETVEEDGYTWVQVKQGDKTGWSVISVQEWCRYAGPVMSSDHYIGENGEIRNTADSRLYTLTVDENSELPGADAFGLELDGAYLTGWSDQPGGIILSMKDLLEEPRGEELTLYAVWGPTQVLLPGDVNNDGTVDNKDVVRLFSILSSKIENTASSVCDVNGDGFVDNKDITCLFRMLSVLSDEKEETADAEASEDTDADEDDETVEGSDGTETEEPGPENVTEVDDSPETYEEAAETDELEPVNEDPETVSDPVSETEERYMPEETEETERQNETGTEEGSDIKEETDTEEMHETESSEESGEAAETGTEGSEETENSEITESARDTDE